ncbi:MAG: oligopeptide transporter, OPT family [bacterium]|nr:oligopeptide transporter, OPT family [bacterium]MBK7671209.1 oligopeptide transporter, OPT family [bacterium]
MDVSTGSKSLPENAYRALKPGEKYIPVVPADSIVPEITGYSLTMGLIFAVVFSAAAAYLGLKIGQVFEAAIPITILAIGVSAGLGKKNALQQHVMIQSIGSASGVVVAGAIFTLPGLYILGLEDRTNFLQMCLTSLLGGFLGIVLLIPFRKYFVDDMHGEFPFPEATASTEVLMAGEAGGDQATVLVKSGGIAMLFQLLSAQTIGLWRETFSTTAYGLGEKLSRSIRLEYNMLTEAAVLGLGYIIGLRYSLIIACGSFLSWWVLVPMIGILGKGVHVGDTVFQLPALLDLSTTQIFRNFVRPVGIGAIAMSGMIGVWKSRKIIAGAIKLAASAGKQKQATTEVRTQRDMPAKLVTMLTMAVLGAVFLYFWFIVKVSLLQAVTGLAIVGFISFLFTTVAARAIAIVGSNPVSGMTLMTLIISSVILRSVGLRDEDGMVAALLIGGVVCTALSMSGGFISDLKIGYWLGTTPATQQKWKFLGTIVSAISVTGVILLLNEAYTFTGGQLQAPQANAMAAVIKPLMTGTPAPWLLYMAGIFMALILQWTGLPALAFALGMYLPLEVNTPVLVGGLIAWFVTRNGTDEQKAKRNDRGTLMASGFVAGGAIMGVLAALIKYVGGNVAGDNSWSVAQALGLHHWAEEMPLSATVTLLCFFGLAYYLYWGARRAAKD